MTFGKLIRFLTVEEVERIHDRLIAQSGGSSGLCGRNAFESAVQQPKATFGGEELYSTIIEKSAILAFTLVKNHPFLDGNKRTGHAAMEVFLLLNGMKLGPM